MFPHRLKIPIQMKVVFKNLVFNFERVERLCINMKSLRSLKHKAAEVSVLSAVVRPSTFQLID